MTKEINVNPILKWAGGKRTSLEYIRKFYEKLKPNKYVEPFFGGGSVYFDILKTLGEEYKKTAIINDYNTDLINMYKYIKSKPKELIKHCHELKDIYSKFDYYHIRDHYNGLTRNKEIVEKYKGIRRAAALIVLNRTCFNGLYRVNSNGLFNVPKGKYNNPRIIDEDNLYKLSKLLPPTQNIQNKEYYKIDNINAGDLVYFDPPYYPLSNTSSFTDYSSSFGEEEHIKLRDTFKKLNDKGVFVILSNSSAEFVKELYNGFKIHEIYVGRHINSQGTKRGKIPEYLILSNNFL